MLNTITISGRLVSDPELRRTGGGVSVASFTLAVERDYKDASGQRETDFIPCVAWRQTGEFASNYFSKGQQAIATGRLQMRRWTDKDGNKRTTSEVVAEHVYFCGGKAEGKPASVTPPGEDFAELDGTDDDLPF